MEDYIDISSSFSSFVLDQEGSSGAAVGVTPCRRSWGHAAAREPGSVPYVTGLLSCCGGGGSGGISGEVQECGRRRITHSAKL